MDATLPPSRHLVTSLISSLTLPPNTTPATNNPLKDATPETHQALLTLHVLFPNELLPALDLLDRGLVTRLVLRQDSNHEDHPGDTHRDSNSSKDGRRPAAVIHYVLSAQQHQHHQKERSSSRPPRPTSIPSYQVHLTSWTCSCPAFAFAAFPAETGSDDHAASTSSPSGRTHSAESSEADGDFGGLTLGTSMPVCKHLLACVLVERTEMFGSFATEREVSVKELAGWAAGWGD